MKVVIPYYEGNPYVQRAVRTWISPDTVFALTDKGIIPPGSGIAHQFFTEKNGTEIGSKKTIPFLIDIMRRLIEMYPDEDYYGCFNSDIIIPPGSSIKNLLPRGNKRASFHHRLNIPLHQPFSERGGSVEIWGKDGFFMDKALVLEMLSGDYGDPLVGGVGWDDSLIVWAWKRIGKEMVDLRYGEVWHPTHNHQPEYESPEGKYNFATLKRTQQHLHNWPIEYKAQMVAQATKPMEKPKTIGIIQPARIGDLMLVLPIAKHYNDEGCKVIWPVLNEYLSLFDYVPYVQAVDIGGLANCYLNAHRRLKEIKVDRVIDLGIGFGRQEKEWIDSGLQFDEWKYKEAGVPFEKRFNLEITRDLNKENELLQVLVSKFGLNGRSYNVVHEDGSDVHYTWNIPNAVKISPLPGFTILDWIGIIENASSFYSIDSCLCTLVNQMGLCIGRRFVKYRQHPATWDISVPSGLPVPGRGKLISLSLANDWGIVK